MNGYINISEKYGEQVEATLSDYRELNPDGTFVQNDKEIREVLPNGDEEVVAEWQAPQTEIE